MPDIQTTFQSLIDNAVKQGVAPSLQCVVFNRNELFFNGASGFASLPSEENPIGRLMTPSTAFWAASCTKIVVSLVALQILENGLIGGVTFADLDNPDVLSKIVPEFAPESGTWLSKVTDGFEDHLGPDGKRILKLRTPKNRVTLRHLLTHTSGIGTYAYSEILKEMMIPSDGSVPLIGSSLEGRLVDCLVPLLSEPGTSYHYGFSVHWLAQWLTRGMGKNLRELFKEVVFDPLEISMSEIDLWFSPAISAHIADYHVRDSDSPSKFRRFYLPFKMYSPEKLDEGMVYSAEAGLYFTGQTFAKVLQAVLNKDPRIMSPGIWELSFKDDLGPRGLKLPRPDLKSMLPMLNDLVEFSDTNSENGTGLNLLQCKVAMVPYPVVPLVLLVGGGIANTYYFVDPVAGFGGFIGTHLFPFVDPEVVELRDQFEGLVYRTLGK